MKRNLIRPLTAAATILAALLASACTSGADGDASSRAPAGEMLANADFESGPSSGAPTGWLFEDRVKGKGSVALVDEKSVSGARALRLTPNQNNTEEALPLAIGQGFDASNLRGASITISGSLAAEGQAEAVAGLYAIRSSGEIVARAEIRNDGATMSSKSATLNVPADSSVALVIARLGVLGTSGSAYFDNFSLSTGPGERAAAPSTPTGETLTASITVRADRDIRTIPRSIYGANIEWVHDALGMWDPQHNRLAPEIIRLSERLGVTSIRFPGGVYSDFYDWRKGVGPRNQRPESKHFPEGPTSRHNFGTDEALNFAKQIGGELFITVNAGTGTPEQAAAWINYVNDPSKVRERGWKVTDWEVGNELYIKDESPVSRASTIGPDEYARRFQSFATAMRQADPDIRIGAIGGENYGKYVQNSFDNWNRTVLSAAGDQIDFL
ncbi:MAG: hypothetical protein VYC34_09625, partial [Planctomycetota bacterium]|nr:hypothetical protein [Planctomycetota bacterium]